MIQEAKKIIDAGVIGKPDHVQAFNDVPYGYVYFHGTGNRGLQSVPHTVWFSRNQHMIWMSINFLVGEKAQTVCAMKSKQIFKGNMPAGLRCSELQQDHGMNGEHL